MPLAVQCFLAQDYRERELVVLDDGDEPVDDLLPDDPRIRYERLEGRLVIGAKRNRACGLARGELIAHWDDDDWSSPRRLSIQVEALERGGGAVVGLRELYFLDPVARRAWSYSYPSRSNRPWVAGGSLCYRRSFWKAHPFQEVSVGEDTRFVWARGARVVALERRDFYVALMHRANTSAKRPRAPRWSPARVRDVEALLGNQAAAYRAAAAGEAPRTVPAAASRVGEAPRSAPVAGSRAGADHVTVTIPYHRCREHVRQCVESVLGQTHLDLTAVVVNDGDRNPPWDLLDDIDDPRLVRFDLSRNRGRYFADQVVLAATDAPYLFIHDADDWSDPRRFEVLLERLRAEGAVGAVCAARRSADRHGAARVVAASGLARRPTERFVHIANLHGLFRTDALRAIGGFYAGFVVGYDSFLINALAMTGHIAHVDEPLYHWRARSNSLTSSRETGMGSALRRRTTRELQVMYRSAYRAYAEHRAGTLDADALAASIRRLAMARVGSRLRRELESEAGRLEAALRSGDGAALKGEPVRAGARRRPSRRVPARAAGVRQAPARAATPARAGASARTGASARAASARSAAPVRRRQARARAAPRPRVADVYDLLARAELRWGGWAISRPFAVELAERLDQRAPRRILELGSGLSTAVLAQYAARRSARVVTLEHDPVHATRTRRLLASLGLAGAVDIRRAPLLAHACPDGRTRPWYGAQLDGEFDFVLADGPPQARGRGAALFALRPFLADEWELWLDDAHRKHERDCLALWRKHLVFEAHVHDVDEKGLAVLGPAGRSAATKAPGARGLGISVLTGGRPALLRQTLDSLARAAPCVLAESYVLVHVNGHDGETEEYVRGLPFVDDVLVGEERLRVGPATSRVVTELAGVRGVRFLMHLEDDWAASTVAGDWLERGLEVLRSEPNIGQVRLRHRSDTVLGRHMVTGKPIAWDGDGHVMRSACAHFTFNPSLMRCADARRLFPCDSERAAQQAFVHAGLGTAQLSPGVFRHIGTHASLHGRGARR